MTTVWLCEPRSHGRNKAVSPLPGRLPSVAVPHRSASPALRPCGHEASSFRRCASSFVGRPVCKPPERGARVPVCKAARGGHRQACVVGRPVRKPTAEQGARVPVCKAARGGHRQACVCGWSARVQAPRAGGTGARVQGRSRRPQAGAAWAVVARCVRGTSSRSASAACGVRGVRAAQQRGSRQSYQSKRNASSIMLS